MRPECGDCDLLVWKDLDSWSNSIGSFQLALPKSVGF